MDLPLPHLDRLFDYLVPEDLDDVARPGVRLKVRFSGQLVDAWLLERVADSEHPKLAYLEKVVSGEPVLSAEIARLAREVADRYAGSLADVLRLAVPPRHAAAEKPPKTPTLEELPPSPPADPADPAEPADPSRHVLQQSVASDPLQDHALLQNVTGTVPAGRAGRVGGAGGAGWGRYAAGEAYLRALADGRAPRAVWSAAPGEDWPARLAEAIAVTVESGRGAVAVVADARDLDRLDEALTVRFGGGDRHVALSAALGPAERYRRFLRASRGEVSAVIGNRASAFAPVAALGFVAIWDDGDDLHSEQRSPYPHARQTLLNRAQLAEAAVLVAGFTRTAEGQQLVESGWAREINPGRDEARRIVVQTADDRQLARDPAAVSARLPSVAWEAARESLRAGAPVLVQVPRRGYLPSVACQDCRERARCPHCAGPLALTSSQSIAECRWCARPAGGYTCPRCGGRRLRASVTGVRRTAEEMGRALPGYTVRTSGRDGVLPTVTNEPALVLATPGAEPVAEGGYGAVLLLDTWALLTRADLRAGEEALRRWMNAAALARPGGRVIVVADGSLVVVQALMRWDAAWLAARELAERRELGFPPAARFASLTGTPAAVAEQLAATRLPTGADLLGPIELPDGQERMLVRVTRSHAAELAAALHAAAGVRSARKAPDAVRVQMDPLELL
ncbi:primosomal protein N' [Allocatelliglobosispora scoriae]|uniref:primosomal protein N' n=1 Tax=Allocatelliglobosispora scoriae TaxID=643052 RepID=UPI00161D6E84|nr:primosomal protein N' [Allocatelliglobosispora scoriae]